MTTCFNGASNIVQAGGLACLQVGWSGGVVEAAKPGGREGPGEGRGGRVEREDVWGEGVVWRNVLRWL